MATRLMSAGSLKPIVDRTGSESSEYQFAREAYQNACEANASKVRIRWEQGASRLGIYRFEIADDGESMTNSELPSFVNKFGGGGKPIGDQHENYGVGLKSSTLPWNHHGILLAARRDGETNLIQLHLDETAGEYGEYGLRQWEAEDEQGELELIDVLTIGQKVDGKWVATCDRDLEPVRGTRVRDILDAFIHDHHGTVVILCGDSGEENTFLATGAGGGMGRGGHTNVATYLSRRYWELPVPLVVMEPRNGNVSEWPKSPDEFAASHIAKAGNSAYRIKSRNPIGIGTFLACGGDRGKKKPEFQGSLTLSDGTQAHWFMLPEGDSYDGKGAGGVYWNPTIAVLYRNEVYLPGGNQRQRFRDFGISRKSVIDRCTIILEPPENNGGPGVYPDSSRSRLLWTGGRHLPWSKWAQGFASNLPSEIQEAIAKATAELGRLEDNIDLNDSQRRRLKALTDRLRSSWRRRARPSDKAERVKIIRVSPVDSGVENHQSNGSSGDGGGGNGGRNSTHTSSGPEARFVEDPDGELIPTVPVKKPDQIPECKWIPAKEFDNQHHAAQWNEAEFVVEANEGCPIFQESIDYWCNQFPAVDQDDVARSVRKVYGFKLRGVVAHMLTAKRRGMISSDDAEKALDSLALTTATAGFIVEDIALAGDLGALNGKASKGRRSPR